MEVYRKTVRFPQAERTIAYYITADVFSDPATETARTLYGIGVTILESGETELVSSILFAKEDVLRLARLLADNLVTPVTVCDIVVDWLSAGRTA
jgi:hypothetical protein